MPVVRDGLLTFRFEAQAGPWGERARLLEVRWFEAGATPRVGEHWQLPLRVLPPRGRINFAGPDSERYWFGEGVHGLGTVKGEGAVRLAAAQGLPVQRMRATLRDRLNERVDGIPGAGLVHALALGERSGLSENLRDVMRVTGTGHLLAISGLHVGLVALFASGIARGSLLLIGWRNLRWPARRLAPLVGLAMALVYGGLAGFGTSPRRAIVMLSVLIIVLCLRRRTGPWRAWSVALVAVLIFDPVAPLQAGFWLSFGAVLTLIALFAGRVPRPRRIRAFLRAQAGLMVTLFPAGLAWFQSFSLGALLANAAAIPWVSFVTLPFALLSLPATVLDGVLAEVVADMALRSAEWLENGLTGIAARLEWGVVTARPPGRLSLLIAIAGAALCLLPKPAGFWRIGWLLALPLLLPSVPRDNATVQIDVLDAGQGQATLVRTATHRLLVDVGPGMPGAWDRIPDVIRPALADPLGSGPDLVVVSHGDLDHAGGLEGVRQAWPRVSLVGNRRAQSRTLPPCHSGRSWVWDSTLFRVLHPSPFLPYRGNDSSCVLEIVAPGGRILLPGDVGRLVERRLVRIGQGDYRLLLAPHHGSRTSSSDEFLAWARPERAVFSTGYANRFGFPHPEVTDRYARHGVTTADTSSCGGLRFVLHKDGRLESRAARRERHGFWRFPAAADCPAGAAVRR